MEMSRIKKRKKLIRSQKNKKVNKKKKHPLKKKTKRALIEKNLKRQEKNKCKSSSLIKIIIPNLKAF